MKEHNMEKLYIIEARDSAGKLLLGDYPQPESVFGMKAITGMDDWQMSRVVFSRVPDATLDGGNIPSWPSLIDPNWKARRKTW